MTDPMAIPPMVLRVALVAVGLGLWFLTQSLLRDRPDGTGILGDGLRKLMARIHAFVLSNPRRADGLLIVRSLGIDWMFLATSFPSGRRERPAPHRPPWKPGRAHPIQRAT